MLTSNLTENLLREVFDDVILRHTKQYSEYTMIYENVNYKKLFIEQLHVNRFRPLRLKEIAVNPNYRLPSFYLSEDTAYFGFAQWERLMPGKIYKTWRSEKRKREGATLIQITSASTVLLWVNDNLKESMHTRWKINTTGAGSD
jgi:hypothetical protein